MGFLYSIIRPLIQSFIHSIIQSLNQSIIQSFKHSNIQSFNHSIIQSFNHSIIQTEWPENTLKRTTIVSLLTHSVRVYIVATSEKLSTINNDTHGTMMHILQSYWVSGVQLITILTINLCLYHQPVIGRVRHAFFSVTITDKLCTNNHDTRGI